MQVIGDDFETSRAALFRPERAALAGDGGRSGRDAEDLMTRIFLCLCAVLLVAGCDSRSDRYARHMARADRSSRPATTSKHLSSFGPPCKQDPASTRANYQLGLIAEQRGDWNAAGAYFTKVTDQDPRHLPALVQRGRIDLIADDQASASLHAGAVLALDPGNADGYAIAARCRCGQKSAWRRRSRTHKSRSRSDCSMRRGVRSSPVFARSRARRSRPSLF